MPTKKKTVKNKKTQAKKVTAASKKVAKKEVATKSQETIVKPVETKKIEKKVDAKVVEKPTATKPVEAKASVAKPVDVKPVVKPVEARNETSKKGPQKKTIEVSRFFYSLVIILVVIIYAQLIAGAVLYYNKYEIQIRSPEEVWRARQPAPSHRIDTERYHKARLHAKRSTDFQMHKHDEIPPLRKSKASCHAKKDLLLHKDNVRPVEAPKPEIKVVERPRRHVRRVPPKVEKPVVTQVKKEASSLVANKEVVKAKNDVPPLACPPPVKRNVVFNEQEYLSYDKVGKAVIEGELCVPLKDGSQKCFENVEVFINPVTSYSDEWYKRGWAGRENIEQAHPRAYYYNKKVRTGKGGKFKFENLVPGSYYVASAVCVPEAKDTQKCRYHRFAAKVNMKNYVKPKLQQVFP